MPKLLTVAGGQIELALARHYVIGRDQGCDIVVEDAGCSRRHARLTVGRWAGASCIEDLKSRNGTYVNGTCVTGRTELADGTRIQLGATVFVWRVGDADAAERAALDSETVTIRPAQAVAAEDELRCLLDSLGSLRDEFAGQMSRVALPQILEYVHSTRRSGTLHVVTAGGAAEIQIRLGCIRAASFQDRSGFPALVQLAKQHTGLFWLEERTDPCADLMREDTAELLQALRHATTTPTRVQPGRD